MNDSGRVQSIRQRLLNMAKAQSETFDTMLLRYGMERLLYRISVSRYRDQFLLKGALLFSLWYSVPHRPTRDMDLLGFGPSDTKTLEMKFRDICSIEADDGLVFDQSSVQGGEIRKNSGYQGVRIKLTATLGTARIPFQIDVGFGDAVVPGPERITYPVLLDHPSPNLLVYPIYAVIAEKFNATVQLGMENSRVKDLFDLWFIFESTPVDGAPLVEAVSATFQRRSTPIGRETPAPFTAAYQNDPQKHKQWLAFLNKNRLQVTSDFHAILRDLERALMPAYAHCLSGEPFGKKWVPATGWV
ncbi:MAG: nucleotidyl transferase AbiEii/AbiGii toxin family protein [Pseudomonadota bacterium]